MSRAETGTGTEALSGADILVKSLVDHDVEVIFAYPGGASMPLHQALTRYSDKLRTILPPILLRPSLTRNWTVFR